MRGEPRTEPHAPRLSRRRHHTFGHLRDFTVPVRGIRLHDVATLERMGCRTLGDVRKLPRGGLARRFDKALLLALDQAYGLRPEAYEWVVLPESFHARLELMARVETAPALLFGARRLLVQMAGWLSARRLGATAFTLRWRHDAMGPKNAGAGGEFNPDFGDKDPFEVETDELHGIHLRQ